MSVKQNEKDQILDLYEKVLMDNQDELYLHASSDYRDGWLDGAYLLYTALVDGARR